MPAGRPPIDEEARDRVIRLRVSADERKRWEALASARGVSLSKLIRERLLDLEEVAAQMAAAAAKARKQEWRSRVPQECVVCGRTTWNDMVFAREVNGVICEERTGFTACEAHWETNMADQRERVRAYEENGRKPPFPHKGQVCGGPSTKQSARVGNGAK